MFGNQWRPCKSDTCSLGKGVKEIIREAGPILAATLGTMSFINQDQHLFPVADHTKRLMANNLGLIIGTDLFDLVLVTTGLSGSIVKVELLFDRFRQETAILLPKLVDHHHIEVGAVIGELALGLFGTADLNHLFVGEHSRFRQLLLKISAIVDHQDLVTLQLGATTQSTNQKHHGQALAAALGMPPRSVATRSLPAAYAR